MMTKMIKTFKHVWAEQQLAALPTHLQQATVKMQMTISRLEQTADVTLFKTDYLE